MLRVCQQYSRFLDVLPQVQVVYEKLELNFLHYAATALLTPAVTITKYSTLTFGRYEGVAK